METGLQATKQRMHLKKTLLLYMAGLMVVWTAFELLLAPALHQGQTGGNSLAIALELLIWTIPAFCLMRLYNDQLYIPVRQAFSFSHEALQWTLFLGAIVAMANLLILAVRVQALEIDLHLEGATLLESVVLIGLTEELVFRGWVMNAYAKQVGPWRASFIAEGLLIAMHIPAWILEGMFSSYLIVFEVVKVFVLGIFYGIAFKKSHCIWTSMAVHMLFNFMQAALFQAGH